MNENEEVARLATEFDKLIKLDLVTRKNRFKLAWYVLTGRAISVGYLIDPRDFYKNPSTVKR